MAAVEVPVSAPCARRAGGPALDLLAVPLNGMIMRALSRGSLRHTDLRRELGNPAETTLRGHLARLEELGVVERRVRAGGPYARNELTGAGIDLLITTRALEGWLSRAPRGPVRLGTVQAKGAVKALVGAWDSALLRALAAVPLTLTQLDRLIATVSYPALERRLAAMRATGMAESKPGSRGGTPYSITHWTRLAAGPILAAMLFETVHMADAPPLTAIDVETAFLLVTPIAPLPPNADGSCVLAVEVANEAGPMRACKAGVEVTVDRGRILSCVTKLNGEAGNFALGPILAWLEALIYRCPERLRIGEAHLPHSLVHGIHEQLFDPARWSA